MGEGQQQPGITKEQSKDLENLQKLGEEMGKKAKEEMDKSAKDSINQKNETLKSNQTLQVYTTKNDANAHNTFNLLNITIAFAIPIILCALSLRRASKNKDKSRFRKGWYYYSKFTMMGIGLLFIGNLVNSFVPRIMSAYIIFLFGVIGLYIYFKVIRSGVKGDGQSKVANNIEGGVVIGSLNNNLIIKTPEQSGNVLVIGAPGKGKSVNVIIPTLLNWKGSSIVIDIKREIYAYTHNVQEGKGRVIVFDPEQGGHSYDPVKECTTVDSCQFLARTIVPTPPNTSDPMWTQNAQNILAAACYEANKEGKTLPDIAERILMTESEVLISELTQSKYREVQLLSSSVKGTPEKTLGGVFTELKSKMVLFATDPNIRQALSKSEWTAEDLEEGATIYLRVSERQIETYKQVWNLIIVQIIRHLASRPEHKNPPVLLSLDELARLGKVEGYADALTTLRSKGVTIVTAIQSLAQLQEHYGKDVTRKIMDTNSYKLVLSAADNETQKVFSDLAGKDEIKKKSASYSLGGGGISEFKQWEERFRPENFAYLKRPIYYPPDAPAFEVDKAFWMNISYFVKLQKKYGGPTGFMGDEEILERSTFKREDKKASVNLEKMVINITDSEEREKEKKFEHYKTTTQNGEEDDDLNKYLYEDNQEEEGGVNIKLVEKKIK